MKVQYTITIATVVFNGAATLAETIESIMAQSYKHIEFVIVDGASKDSTVDIIKSYAAKHDHIKFVSEPDAGIYDAMNKALQLASSDFLLFLGADDVLYNDKVIEEVVNQITDTNSVCYGDVFAKDTKEIWYGPFTTEKIVLQNICHQAIFYPKHIYKTNTYSLKYKFFSDWDYNLRVWAKLGSFKRIDLIITLFAEQGASHGQDATFAADRLKLVTQYFGNKYNWLIKMQQVKQKLFSKTDLRKVKGYIFPKVK